LAQRSVRNRNRRGNTLELSTEAVETLAPYQFSIRVSDILGVMSPTNTNSRDPPDVGRISPLSPRPHLSEDENVARSFLNRCD
jgi:hypothetical protein